MKIIPVIHHLDEITTLENADICAEANVFGIFLISMEGDNKDLPSLAKKIKEKYPTIKVGLNLLGESALSAVEKSLLFDLDMTWSDNPIVTGAGVKNEAYDVASRLKNTTHMFFNSIAFKYQSHEINPGLAGKLSKELNFIPTTSGSATGVAAEMHKLKLIKDSIGDYPLAIASGLDLNNVIETKTYIEYGLVATGISESFYKFDFEKTVAIVAKSN